jgi:hypothetical protein
MGGRRENGILRLRIFNACGSIRLEPRAAAGHFGFTAHWWWIGFALIIDWILARKQACLDPTTFLTSRHTEKHGPGAARLSEAAA